MYDDDKLRKAIAAITAFDHAFADMNRFRSAVRAAAGAIEDVHRSLRLHPGFADKLLSIQRLSADLHSHFRLPDMTEMQKLIDAWDTSRMKNAPSLFRDHAHGTHRAMEAMTTPWLDIDDPSASFEGLLGLHDIGHILSIKSVFGAKPSERLRHHLGDWRSSTDLPATVLSDPLERSHFYVERGLNSDLTYFPADAFDQALDNAGIKQDSPPYVQAYDRTEHKEEEEDVGFERNNAAHDRLQRFESHVRAFIDQQMTVNFGSDWIEHHIPGDMRRRWKEKRAKAIHQGGDRDHPLIAYADFTDYLQLIVQKDNWNRVFAPVFQRKALVEESFQRLYPVRICTMHARIISQDDELYLHAETRRILIAMGASE